MLLFLLKVAVHFLNNLNCRVWCGKACVNVPIIGFCISVVQVSSFFLKSCFKNSITIFELSDFLQGKLLQAICDQHFRIINWSSFKTTSW